MKDQLKKVFNSTSSNVDNKTHVDKTDDISEENDVLMRKMRKIQ